MGQGGWYGKAGDGERRCLVGIVFGKRTAELSLGQWHYTHASEAGFPGAECQVFGPLMRRYRSSDCFCSSIPSVLTEYVLCKDSVKFVMTLQLQQLCSSLLI